MIMPGVPFLSRSKQWVGPSASSPMPTNLICSEPVAEESERRSWDMASPENAAAFLSNGALESFKFEASDISLGAGLMDELVSEK